jgi:hypothetical protein
MRNRQTKIVTSEHENTNISNKGSDNNENTVAQKDEKGSQSSTDVSQVSHVSPEQFQCYYCD